MDWSGDQRGGDDRGVMALAAMLQADDQDFRFGCAKLEISFRCSRRGVSSLGRYMDLDYRRESFELEIITWEFLVYR